MGLCTREAQGGSVTNTVYLTNNLDDKLSVVDGATDTVSESFNRIYVVNSTDGTVSIIDSTTNTVIDTVAVEANPQFIGDLE